MKPESFHLPEQQAHPSHGAANLSQEAFPPPVKNVVVAAIQPPHVSEAPAQMKAPSPPEVQSKGVIPPADHSATRPEINQPKNVIAQPKLDQKPDHGAASPVHTGDTTRPATGPGAEKAPCPPEQSHPHDKTPGTPETTNPHGKTPGTPETTHPHGKTPCPPEQSHPHGKTPGTPETTHPHGKTPCPPEQSHPHGKTPGTPETGHPHGKKPCPPEKTLPHGKTPCPPETTPPAPPKTPEAPPAPPKTPEVPPTSPEAPPTPAPRPIGPSRPPIGRPVNESPTPLLLRYSPPAEQMRPLRPEEYSAPPAAAEVQTPATVSAQVTGMSEATYESYQVKTTQAAATDSHAAVTIAGHEAKVGGKTNHVTADTHGETQVKPDTTGATVAGRAVADTATAQASTTEIAASSYHQSAVIQVAVEAQSPAAGTDQTPANNKVYKSWVETSVSVSPAGNSTVGTATVGTFFNDQNYGYVQGTMDATRGRAGDVSAMYGHSLFSPYDANGNARRGNINVEAGVVVGSGEALEGSKLPIFGKTAIRAGVNGYYDLDKEGKNTVYGGVDFAGSPKQGDVQAGLSHRFDNLTVSGGYERSKVEGYKATNFLTASASYKLNDRAEVYAGAAVSAQKDENRIYTGVRFHF